MTITDLIDWLEKARAEHGDLHIVTPGFDESNFDYCDEPRIVYLVPSGYTGHSGALQEVAAGVEMAEKCVAITF